MLHEKGMFFFNGKQPSGWPDVNVLCHLNFHRHVPVLKIFAIREN
jgi:hypothetical protein